MVQVHRWPSRSLAEGSRPISNHAEDDAGVANGAWNSPVHPPGSGVQAIRCQRPVTRTEIFYSLKTVAHWSENSCRPTLNSAVVDVVSRLRSTRRNWWPTASIMDGPVDVVGDGPSGWVERVLTVSAVPGIRNRYRNRAAKICGRDWPSNRSLIRANGMKLGWQER